MADTKENVRKITCPSCGLVLVESDPDYYEKFRYIEDIEVYREIQGLKDGNIYVDGLYQSGEGYDDGQAPRLECRRCFDQFAVPEWLLKRIVWA